MGQNSSKALGNHGAFPKVSWSCNTSNTSDTRGLQAGHCMCLWISIDNHDGPLHQREGGIPEPKPGAKLSVVLVTPLHVISTILNCVSQTIVLNLAIYWEINKTLVLQLWRTLLRITEHWMLHTGLFWEEMGQDSALCIKNHNINSAKLGEITGESHFDTWSLKKCSYRNP